MSNHASRKISQNCVGEGLCPSRAVRRRKIVCTNAETDAPVGADASVRPAVCTRKHERTNANPHHVCRGRCPSSALRAALRAAVPRNQPAGVASTRTPHVRFYDTLRQICHCPTGGQRRPPLQDVVRFRRKCVQFCDCTLPGSARHRPLRTGCIVAIWCTILRVRGAK